MTTSEQDERRLVEAAQADRERFVELYDRHFSQVCAFVVRRASSRTEAEDVTSEVFRKALENLPGYEWRGAPFKAWLFRIAANTLATRWQKSVRESGDMPADVAEADTDLERHAMLFELVHRLPSVQRQVIELRFIEGRTLLEIAAALGKSEGAVHAELRAFGETVIAGFPDVTWELRSSFANGSSGGAEWVMRATHKGDFPGMPATGKRIEVRGASVFEFVGDKIRRCTDYWDMATCLKQMGLMPSA